MDVVGAVKLYVRSLVKICGQGIKALIVDSETSELFKNEVYLFEKIDNASPDPLNFVKVLYVVRPTEKNVNHICSELNNPRFELFTNTLSLQFLEQISRADHQELVSEVQEIFLDFYPLDVNLFTINLKSYKNVKSEWDHEALTRCSEGLFSAMMSLKAFPQIRYQHGSKLAYNLGSRVYNKLHEVNSLFDDYQPKKNLLLILERNFDPLTPLLLNWTYQAMVHELLTIKNNVVNLSNFADVPPEFHEIPLSAETDGIFQTNMFLTFSELASNIKSMVSDFQTIKKDKQKLDTLSDIKSVVNSLPKYRKISTLISRHITIASELNTLAKNRRLFDQSEFEQSLINHIELEKPHFDILIELINSPSLTPHDALRLSLIYIASQQNVKVDKITKLKSALKSKNLSNEQLKVIDCILPYYRSASSALNIFQGESKAISITKRYIKNILQVDNPEVIHHPGIEHILQSLSKLNSIENIFPCISSKTEKNQAYSNIIIFIIGGCTYDESLYIHKRNKNSIYKVLLGGTFVHNSSSYFDEILQSVEH